jgi:16S rRNA (guanine527-N7)-methyltransferase
MPSPIDSYAELLLEWNRTLNLTGARDLEEIKPHLEDARSLLVLSWDRVRRAIDIGSGGGLPGIPLAIALPAIHFTLLEANVRKAAFLQHVAGSLQLKNVAVEVGRAEVLAHDPRLRERFDRAISRAVARPPILLELALAFVLPGGDLVAEVGSIEATGLEGISRRLGGGLPRLQPAGAPERQLLVVPKIAATPQAYPRPSGVPGKRPLT